MGPETPPPSPASCHASFSKGDCQSGEKGRLAWDLRLGGIGLLVGLAPFLFGTSLERNRFTDQVFECSRALLSGLEC